MRSAVGGEEEEKEKETNKTKVYRELGCHLAQRLVDVEPDQRPI